MKTLILVLLVTLSGTLSAQTLPELIEAYERYCDEIVLDTIELKGEVRYNSLPVYDGDKIVAHKLTSVDTLWETPECPIYKDIDDFSYYRGTILRLNSGGSSTIGNYIIIDVVKKSHVCEVKRRRPLPFSENFWEFCKKYNK